MKSNKIKLTLLTFTSALLYSMPVYATDTGNAVVDILKDDRFSGAMSSIKWLTEMVDNWFIQIITVVAFFIIAMSLLKNAMAAAYCAFPKFFNKVDQAHQSNAALKFSKEGMKEFASQISNRPISDVILGIIPNLKAFTDFEDMDMSPKQYFLKAVPQMCAMVILGIFIYNGYYRDVSATVGSTGAAIVNNFLSSVDPEKAVNTIFNTTSKPVNMYASDKSSQGEYIHTISEELYTKIVAYAELIPTDQTAKDGLMRDCEDWAYKFVTGDTAVMTEAFGGNGDKMMNDINQSTSNSVTSVSGETNTETGEQEQPVFANGMFAGGSIFKCAEENYKFRLTGVSATVVKTANKGTGSITPGKNGSISFVAVADMASVHPTAGEVEQGASTESSVVLSGTLTPVFNSDKQSFETAIEAISSSSNANLKSGLPSTLEVDHNAVNAHAVNDKYTIDLSNLRSYIMSTFASQLGEGVTITNSNTIVFSGGNYNGTETEGHFTSGINESVVKVKIGFTKGEQTFTEEFSIRVK